MVKHIVLQMALLCRRWLDDSGRGRHVSKHSWWYLMTLKVDCAMVCVYVYMYLIVFFIFFLFFFLMIVVMWHIVYHFTVLKFCLKCFNCLLFLCANDNYLVFGNYLNFTSWIEHRCFIIATSLFISTRQDCSVFFIYHKI